MRNRRILGESRRSNKKVIRLTESQLTKVMEKTIGEYLKEDSPSSRPSTMRSRSNTRPSSTRRSSEKTYNLTESQIVDIVRKTNRKMR